MQLTLMRHGEAETRAISDASRRLTKNGRKENLATAAQLLSHEPIFSHALHSPYLRAKETADDLNGVLQNLHFENSELLTPDIPVASLLNHLEQFCRQQQVSSLLLIGHNPLLSRLLSLLVDGSQDGSRYLDTSNLVCLNVEMLAPACAEINYWLQPH